MLSFPDSIFLSIYKLYFTVSSKSDNLKILKINLRSLLLFFFFSIPLSAQDTVTVMAYNLLFYDVVPQVRDTNFRKIIEYTKPDILLVQEIDNQAPVNNFLNSVMNYYNPGLYTVGQYFNGPNWDVAVYYKPSLFELQQVFPLFTSGRNIMGYKFRHIKTDRIFFAFGLHLRAGYNQVDQKRSNEEVSVFRSRLYILQLKNSLTESNYPLCY